MKHSEILAHINQLITEINRLNGIIQGNISNPKKLDIDLLLKKVPELYDDLLALSSNSSIPEKAPDTVPEPPEEVKAGTSPGSPQLNEEIEISFEQEIKPTGEKQKEETPEDIVESTTEAVPETTTVVESSEKEPETEEVQKAEPFIAPITKEKPQEPVIEEKPVKKEPEKQPSLFDTTDSGQGSETRKSVFEKFSKSEPSINEKIADQKKVPLAEKVKKNPISDIKSAINLNLKLSFIKELFKNDQKEYKRVIDFIQKCGNYSEAKLFISGEMDKNPHWKNHLGLVDKLMELIERRFR